MAVEVEKVEETEVLVADLGKLKLYRIVEETDDLLENTGE